MKIKRFHFLILLALAVMGLTFFHGVDVHAHRVNLFAWVEGGQVVVSANFGKNRPAINAGITVLDSDTNALVASGKTNDSGLFTFKAPEAARKGQGLNIQVNAGEGHANSWHMSASELADAEALAAGFEKAANDNSGPRQTPALPRTESRTYPTGSDMPTPKTLSEADIRKIAREETENKIAPLRGTIVSLAENGPSFIEIVGGIGWIAGITGIILYFKSRRRQTGE